MTTVLIWISSSAFLFYGISYFKSAQLQQEFVRYGLQKFGPLTAVLEILGAVGLLVGLVAPPILIFASGGLTLLMLLGFGVRVKIRDGFWLSLPSFLFMLLNGYICYVAWQSYTA
ncbi:DoxX family protein [Hymenobacter sp. H14-R3]|uniref:DoxX family protein n=1 Tax=Hymenobacter sp. H14-R3 TaxID=3046308 RepID=UPI0024BA0856|nr:DoxX family protein [Hymenobacter sp. H14-R3]MDJ0367449.1 DoxX family protein [Hymenobacter sp. H14-R3]